MFILQFSDFSNISKTNDPADPNYNPIFFLLDSTALEPAPSSPAEVLASLPAGYFSMLATVTSAGNSANRWKFTLDDPALVTAPNWLDEISFDIPDGIRKSFWVRAETVSAETPKDDREVSVNIYGEVEET